MREAGMAEIIPLGSDVAENTVFGVLKVFNESQRVIWGGERVNLFFHSQASPENGADGNDEADGDGCGGECDGDFRTAARRAAVPAGEQSDF